MYFEGLDLPRLIILVAVFSVYFMPSYIAALRDHHRRYMIGLLNLLLGWTVIGWLAAFLWATSKTKATHKQARHEQEETEQEETERVYTAEGRVQVDPAAGRRYSKAS